MNLFIPPELWDPILEFLPIRELEKIKLLSSFFFDLIDLNRGFKCKILLYKNGQENRKIIKRFRWAAKNGYLEVLKWLYSTFELTGDDVRSSDNCIFQQAALSGFGMDPNHSDEARLEVLKWLHFTFELTGKDARTRNNYIFQMAALNGQLEVLKWLHLTFELTTEDAKSNNYLAFRWAAARGRLEVLKWLRSTFELTGEDARSNNNLIFLFATENGHTEVLQWLKSTF